MMNRLTRAMVGAAAASLAGRERVIVWSSGPGSAAHELYLDVAAVELAQSEGVALTAHHVIAAAELPASCALLLGDPRDVHR